MFLENENFMMVKGNHDHAAENQLKVNLGKDWVSIQQTVESNNVLKFHGGQWLIGGNEKFPLPLWKTDPERNF